MISSKNSVELCFQTVLIKSGNALCESKISRPHQQVVLSCEIHVDRLCDSVGTVLTAALLFVSGDGP